MGYLEIKDVTGFTKREAAQELSRILWNIERPDSAKAAEDVTRYLFGIHPHPVNEDDWVVNIDESVVIKKHANAVASEILTLTEELSTEEENSLTDLITNNSEIAITDIINSIRPQIIEYPVWGDLDNGHSFSLSDKVSLIEQTEDDYELVFYNCIQAHNKQSDWSPHITPALWSKVTIQGEIEVWSQPTGGDGKYPYLDPNTGEQYLVTHNGSTWRNTHQGGLNVWAPGVFGWEEVV